MTKTTKSSLVYVADPMCSWCYAFGPQLERVLDATGLPMRIVVGGLFVGDSTAPLDEGLRRYLRETWQTISQISGRPVSYGLLDRDHWTYDTEPACRAVVAVRERGDAAPVFFDHLQQAFYEANRDIADPSVVSAVSNESGVPVDEAELSSSHLAALTRADFDEGRELGARGFPTLLLDTGAERIIVAAGYTRADDVIRRIGVLDS